jgi:DNA replicative helicase MCM subunit Mcm2 (Cdc46/Mcm family)
MKPSTDGFKLEMEFVLNNLIDHRVITIQELFENFLVGQMPKICKFIVDQEISDKSKPGDFAFIYEVYKNNPNNLRGNHSEFIKVSSTQMIFKNHSVSLFSNLSQNDICNIPIEAKHKDIADLCLVL